MTDVNATVAGVLAELLVKNGCAVSSITATHCGASAVRAPAIMPAIASGRINAGAIAVPWQKPLASVHSSASACALNG